MSHAKDAYAAKSQSQTQTNFRKFIFGFFSKQLFIYSKCHTNSHTYKKQAARTGQCQEPGVPEAAVEATVRASEAACKVKPRPSLRTAASGITQSRCPTGNSKNADLFSPITANISSLHHFPAQYQGDRFRLFCLHNA